MFRTENRSESLLQSWIEYYKDKGIYLDEDALSFISLFVSNGLQPS